MGVYGSVGSAVVRVHVNEALPVPAYWPRWEASTEWFPIQAVVVSNDVAYVGGLFRMLDDSGRRDLVKLSAAGVVDPAFSPDLTGGEVGGVTSLCLAPNGQILVGGNFTRVNGESQPHLARLNPDGTLDETFRPLIEGKKGGIYTLVHSIGILSDGRILIEGVFASVEGRDRSGLAWLSWDGRLDESFDPAAGRAPEDVVAQADGRRVVARQGEVISAGPGLPSSAAGYSLRRIGPDGVEDPGFCPLFDGFVKIKAMRRDGSVLVTGLFSKGAGFALPRLALVGNDAVATQALEFDGSSARWRRSGTSPEVGRVTFEFSTDGVTWRQLGTGIRVADGWQLDGVRLESPGSLRARGSQGGSIYDATIDVAIGPRLEASGYRFRDGELALSASVPAGSRVILQSSADLQRWTSIRTNLASDPRWNFVLTNQQASRSFFRLIPAGAGE